VVSDGPAEVGTVADDSTVNVLTRLSGMPVSRRKDDELWPPPTVGI
jgi:hypothetical protein